MDYIYILIDCDGDSWNPVPRNIGYYRTEEAAVDAVPDFAKKYEGEPINAHSDPTRVTVREFGYFRVDKVKING